MEHCSHLSDVSRETRDALEQFAALLQSWNRRVNLVSVRDQCFLWERHIADSLQLVQWIPRDTYRAIDLGSGAGFPGLIVSIATGIPFDLIEADQRKAAFLREATRITHAPVRVLASRIETAQPGAAPLVTARALAPLPRLLEFAAPLVAPGGECLFHKGANVEAELTHAAAQWHMQVERIASHTRSDACILRIRDLRRATATA